MKAFDIIDLLLSQKQKIFIQIQQDKMEKRLFLKEKDYEMIKFKSEVKFNQAIHDPLINPNTKNRKNKPAARANIFDSEPSEDRRKQNLLNPLGSGKPQIKQTNVIAQKTVTEQAVKIQTPWTKILELFIKNYDFLKQPMDLQVANPFGSYGLKVEQQLRGITHRNSTKTQDKTKQGEQKTTITIRTYLKVFELMKKEMELKWAQDDKVACLQLAIQACKLLHDSSNAKFQALKFAYVVEIVDRFGILVFERIKKLSFPHLKGEKLQEMTLKSVSEANIPESVQEICRNWLLKIASIRQLMPRTIIETTLLRLHFFINNGVRARSSFERLYKSNRCFGEYMNCLFFATFLVRMGRQLLPQDKDYIIELLDDVFFYVKQGKNKFGRNDISYDEFFNILEPFFITSFENLAENLQKEKFKKFFNAIQQINPHYVVLKNLVQSFSPSHLVTVACQIVRMIQKTSDEQKYQLYKGLLSQICSMVFSQSGEFIILVWTDINQLKDIEVLLQLLGPFSQIIFRNLPSYQKNKFYALILDKFSGMLETFSHRSINKKIIDKFETFLSDIISRTQNIKDIVTLEPFLQLIAYFPQKSKQQISFNIVKTFVGRDIEKIKDPVVVHIMLTMIKNISGFKVGKVNPDKEVEELLIKFVEKVEFEGKQLEELLTLYAQIRASFGYLQRVITSIIYKAAGLTYKVRRLAKGKITNKLIAFLQAAVAFCYITVPVIERPQLKLKLYIYLSEVALTNNLISQSNSFIKTCITQLSECTMKTDVQLYETFARIVSFMVVIPDDPEKEYLFLFNGLYQAFQVSKWKTNFQHILKFLFYTNSVRYLSCQAQQKLPFHIDGVTSNDGLFKSQQFKQALIQKIYQICENLQKTIDKLSNGPTNDQSLDLYVSLNLSEAIMTIVDIFDDSVRVQSMLTKSVKTLMLVKDRAIRRQSAGNVQRIRRGVDGLNLKLKENGFGGIRVI